ncbi:MAG: hypothetical protein R2710_09395 [Acidimicrobiales bacterium]
MIAKLAAIPFMVALTLLLLSDRAPGLTRNEVRKGLLVGRRVERRTGIDIIDHGDLPFSWEQLGHAGLWAIAMVLAAAVFARRASIVQIASGVIAASASFELAQFFFTASRHLEFADLEANVVGVAIGALVAGVLSIVGGSRRRRGFAASGER